MPEFVYIVTNEAMPNLVKIGKTKNDVEGRIRQLYTTPVPLPFELYCCFEVEDSEKVEKTMHKIFNDNRLSSQREFFTISPESARICLEQFSGQEYFPTSDGIETPEERNSINREKMKGSAFNFSRVDIPPGSEISFVNDESIIAKVIGKTKIEFRGIETSLSPAAVTILNEQGRNVTAARGPEYWEFEGKTLNARRKEWEEAEAEE